MSQTAARNARRRLTRFAQAETVRGWMHMIRLTRLSGEPFVLNADLICYVDERPDTYVTLTTGERIVVRESMDEVLRRAVAYQQAKHWLKEPQRAGGIAMPAEMERH